MTTRMFDILPTTWTSRSVDAVRADLVETLANQILAHLDCGILLPADIDAIAGNVLMALGEMGSDD